MLDCKCAADGLMYIRCAATATMMSKYFHKATCDKPDPQQMCNTQQSIMHVVVASIISKLHCIKAQCNKLDQLYSVLTCDSSTSPENEKSTKTEPDEKAKQ